MAVDGGLLNVGKETSMTFLLALYRLLPKGNRMARTYPSDLLTLEISDMKFTCHVQIYYHMWMWSTVYVQYHFYFSVPGRIFKE
jgi:hypothetical protein